MTRKLRPEFRGGAIYHVINRGNDRSWVFKDEGARAAFEGCLFEACDRSGWLLHAFVIMGNHYHLAVETPQGNLVTGMQWLQSTYANRFNAFRGERGHLFQGRYKGLLAQAGDPLGQVCHYLHLNPGLAGERGTGGQESQLRVAHARMGKRRTGLQACLVAGSRRVNALAGGGKRRASRSEGAEMA